MVEIDTITRRFQLLSGMLDERTRRLVAAAEALSIGRGGSVAVARATGISRRAIRQGIEELLEDAGPGAGRVRREGGGRKKTVIKDPSLRNDLEYLMVPISQGDMESPLRWTCKSVRQLTEELKQMGHKTSHRMVAELLHELGYNLQVNRRIKEGRDYADWDAQVAHINRTAQVYFAARDPVVSVEARKKEFVGEFRNGAREGHNYDSVDIEVDHDIETFAVESIQRWWNTTGRLAYAQSRRLLIITDVNGPNVFRTRLWKLEIQKLADETGLAITVCHLPPGTSKWNKIESQFCAYVIQNWRGQPPISYEVVIKLIAPTMPPEGLKVPCHPDTNSYPSADSGSDAELASILLVRDALHEEWSSTVLPQGVSQ